MADQQLDDEVRQLRSRLQLAEEVIRAMEDDAVPPAALGVWERYRNEYPRADP